MTQNLKILIENYKKNLETPNLQLINEKFLDEIIILPDNNMLDSNTKLLDLTFNNALFKQSDLINIRFFHGSFGLSVFDECFFKNCIFSNIHFREMESVKSNFKNCIFIDCIFFDGDISETTFESCTFSKGSLDDCEFKSCHFINTVFQNVVFGFGTLIDSKFSNSKKSIEFEGEVYFNDIFDQIDKFHID